MGSNELQISWGSFWRAFFVIAIAAVFFVARDVLIALFLALVISAAFDPIVTVLERRRVPRILGTLLIYLVGIFLLGLLFYAIIPLAISELSVFLASIDDLSGAVFEFIDTTTVIQTINESLTKLADVLLSGGTSIVDVSTKFLGSLTLAASVFVLSFYLTVGKDGVERFLIAILPAAYEGKVIDLYSRIKAKMGRWLAGQIFLSFLIGFAVFLGLWILGVKYSLLLGIIAGVFELVPFVGPIFSGALGVLVGLTTSLSLGVYTLILFIIIQQLENQVLAPTVTSWTTSLNPVVIIISLMIGATVFGFVGLILAVPAAVFIQEIIEDWSAGKAKRRGLAL